MSENPSEDRFPWPNLEDEYIELLEKTLVGIDAIDRKIPWPIPTGPEAEWWLEMMAQRRMVQQYLDGYDE